MRDISGMEKKRKSISTKTERKKVLSREHGILLTTLF